MAPIKVTTSDGELYELDTQIVALSTTLIDMAKLYPDENDEIVPLSDIHSSTLEKVIEWMNHHKNDEPPKNNDDDEEEEYDISPWDGEFFKVDQVMLFNIIIAANFLDIKGLFDTACKIVAHWIKDKSPEEVRKIFNITDTGYTPEEEEAIRIENAWCEIRGPGL